MGRTPCCDKTSVKRGPWSPEEDTALRNYVERHGTGGNWIALPQKAGLRRCGKSCRLRWLNYLRPDIKHGGFTEEEDIIICTLYNKLGSRWSAIASQLPGRTDNDVKNYWNTKLKKRMMAAQKAPPPPLSSPIKTETFNSSDLSMVLDMVNPIDGGFGFNQDASSPGESLINGYIALAASSSIEVENSSNYINWSANNLLLSELVFGSTSESIGGYDSQEKVADMWVSVDTTPEGLPQRTTYSENPY